MAERVRPAFTRHVQATWPELPELIGTGEAVTSLLAHPGWEAIQRVIAREIATIDEVLDQGPTRDAANYAKAHGRRGALRGAEEAAKAIILEANRRREQAELEQAKQVRKAAA